MKISVFLLLILLSSCSTTSEIHKGKEMKFSIQAGGNTVGIVENTDMSLVPNVRKSGFEISD